MWEQEIKAGAGVRFWGWGEDVTDEEETLWESDWGQTEERKLKKQSLNIKIYHVPVK